jgi:hypothetical protein
MRDGQLQSIGYGIEILRDQRPSHQTVTPAHHPREHPRARISIGRLWIRDTDQFDPRFPERHTPVGPTRSILKPNPLDRGQALLCSPAVGARTEIRDAHHQTIHRKHRSIIHEITARLPRSPWNFGDGNPGVIVT